LAVTLSSTTPTIPKRRIATTAAGKRSALLKCRYLTG
jgi:hypothetical protein